MHDADPHAGVLEDLRPRLRVMALRLGVPWTDADDVVHETLLAAIEKLAAGQFRNDSTIATWVHGILKHEVLDYWRDKQRGARRLVEIGADGETGSAIPEQIASTTDPETRLLYMTILMELPPHERVVLLLNQQDGLTAREIAPQIRVGRKVAETLLTAAKKRLARLVWEAEERAGTKRLT